MLIKVRQAYFLAYISIYKFPLKSQIWKFMAPVKPWACISFVESQVMLQNIIGDDAQSRKESGLSFFAKSARLTAKISVI